MAILRLGGEAFEIAPFRLRDLRLAGPAIDRLSARMQAMAGGGRAIEGVADAGAIAFDLLTVMAVGIEGATPQALEARRPWPTCRP